MLKALLAKVRKAGRFYAQMLFAVLGAAYASSALAYVINEAQGPFAWIICPVTTWLAALVVPIATVCFIVLGISFLWGEEMLGMTKKWVNGIIALCIALSGGAIASWAAMKFGVITMC
jgi:hypothetical protein